MGIRDIGRLLQNARIGVLKCGGWRVEGGRRRGSVFFLLSFFSFPTHPLVVQRKTKDEKTERNGEGEREGGDREQSRAGGEAYERPSFV